MEGDTGFGADARRYHRARPSYPAELVRQVVSTISGPERTVVDVGTGTGIAATLFRQAGCSVLGVEPDEQMALLAREAGVELEVARFEEWDLAGRLFWAVVAAQSWHWVDMAAGAAKAASALRPGGRLTVWWNSSMPPAEVNEAIGAVYRKAMPEVPAMADGMPGPEGYRRLCEKAAERMTAAGGFGEAEYWRFDRARDYATAEWLDVVPTFGGWGRIPPAKQQEILAGVGAAIDASGGELTMATRPWPSAPHGRERRTDVSASGRILLLSLAPWTGVSTAGSAPECSSRACRSRSGRGGCS
jgi:SAM-dependent methyltransferase